MFFKKFFNFIRKCPMVFSTIVLWAVLLAAAYLFGVADISDIKSTPAFVGLATEDLKSQPGFFIDEKKVATREDGKLVNIFKDAFSAMGINMSLKQEDTPKDSSGDSGMVVADIDVDDYITDDIESIQLADDDDDNFVNIDDINRENAVDEADDESGSGLAGKNDLSGSADSNSYGENDISGSDSEPNKNNHDKNESGKKDNVASTGKDGNGAGVNGTDTGNNGNGPSSALQVDPTKIVSSKNFVSYVKYDDKVGIDSPYFEDPGKYPVTTEYDYTKVEQSYLDDALFIGDSRTVGLGYYGGLDNATFYAKVGLNIYNLMDDEFIDNPNGKVKQVSIRQMLKKKSFGKIYVCVGINELGIGDTETWAKKYISVLQEIRDLQPDAIIFVQGIMPVAAEKSDGDKVFSNGNIRDKNCELGKLANGVNVFYLDIYSLYMDKKMNLPSDKTSDSVHLFAGEYSKWSKYILKHGV